MKAVEKQLVKTVVKKEKKTKPQKIKAVTSEVLREQRNNVASKSTGIGAAIGNKILPGIGGVLGHAAEGLFKTITGMGDYSEANQPSETIENNTIMGLQTPPVTDMVDNMHWNGQATRIAHREFFGNVGMSEGYAAGAYAIEPTSSFLFPWLSNIAPNFQKWKLLGCVFEYVPTSASAISGGGSAVGSVAFQVSYDTRNDTPSSMINLLNGQGSVSTRPYEGMICPVECDPGYTPMNPLYVAQNAIAPIDDQHNYVFGNLIVATEGPTAQNNCGQLWITYDLQLIAAFVPGSAPKKPIPKPTIDRAPPDSDEEEGDIARGSVER